MLAKEEVLAVVDGAVRSVSATVKSLGGRFPGSSWPVECHTQRGMATTSSYRVALWCHGRMSSWIDCPLWKPCVVQARPRFHATGACLNASLGDRWVSVPLSSWESDLVQCLRPVRDDACAAEVAGGMIPPEE